MGSKGYFELVEEMEDLTQVTENVPDVSDYVTNETLTT